MCPSPFPRSSSWSPQEYEASSSTLCQGYGVAARYRRQSSQRSTQAHSGEEDSDSLGTDNSSIPSSSPDAFASGWQRRQQQQQHSSPMTSYHHHQYPSWRDFASSSSTSSQQPLPPPTPLPSSVLPPYSFPHSRQDLLAYHLNPSTRPQSGPLYPHHGGKFVTETDHHSLPPSYGTTTTTTMTTTTTTTTMAYTAATPSTVFAVPRPSADRSRKTRSSVVVSARSTALAGRAGRGVGGGRGAGARTEEWAARLVDFLASPQELLFDVADDTIVTTLPDGTTREMRQEGGEGAGDKAGGSSGGKSRRRGGTRMATHRFLLPVEASRGQLDGRDWDRIAAAVHGQHYTVEGLAASGCLFISCVRWQGELWITTSDICHVVKFRLEAMGFAVVDREKLFEGVYSDLRVVSKGCFRYEESQGAFLTALDVFGCISMHKRQKLYRWERVPHEQLLNAALRRAVRGGRACRAVRGVALELCR